MSASIPLELDDFKDVNGEKEYFHMVQLLRGKVVVVDNDQTIQVIDR